MIGGGSAALPAIPAEPHAARDVAPRVKRIAPGVWRLLTEVPGIGRHSSAGAGRGGVEHTISQTRGGEQGGPSATGKFCRNGSGRSD